MIFLGPKFWPLSYFLGSMKDAGIFWVPKKNQRDFLGLRKKD